MIRVPTARRRRKPEEKLNLTPIMDAVFIFIFFLLMSANFVKIMEIGSDVPILSEKDPPPPDKDPLMLQVIVKENSIDLLRGSNSQLVQSFARLPEGTYDLQGLHARLVEIKKQRPTEESIILTPDWDISYEELVKVMDSLRIYEKTDEAIFRKGKDGLDEKIPTLFSKIVFSNLMS
jgi:biopolymer transport protein ExbD